MENRLSITKKKLQDEFEKARKRLKGPLHSEGWSVQEPLGRVLHWMNDPTVDICFEKAISSYQIVVENLQSEGRLQSWDLMKIGNYYRLMGDNDNAYLHFTNAYTLAKRETVRLDGLESVNYDKMQYLIQTCFFLGKYEEAVEYGRLFYKDDSDPELLAYLFAQLAKARLADDASLAETAITSLVNVIKGQREMIQATGAITLWDTYELALEALAEIESENAQCF